VDQAIKQDPDPYYRVMDLSVSTYNDAKQAIHHKAIGGYHPAKMESYQDLIDVQLTPGQNLNAQVLNMLNTKYLIFNGQDGQPSYQPNPGACGNAWFVSNIKKVKTADDEMNALNAEQIGMPASDSTGNFKPLETAIVREKELNNIPTTFVKDSASIKLKTYSCNTLTYSVNNSNDGFAVFSDIYYPLGWRATIDGKPANIVKTNYLLRGLFVPKGSKEIVFNFMPETFVKTKTITAGSSYAILILIIGLLGLFIKKELKP
jgi:hypothetical protein